MIALWMTTPRRGEGGPPRRGMPGAPIAGLMVLVIMALWAGLTWLAASRYEGLHVVTFGSEWPGEARVLVLPAGAEAWQVAFLARHPPAAQLSREQWEQARVAATWLPAGFRSGPSLKPAEGRGATFLVQLRGGPPSAPGAELPPAGADGLRVDVAYDAQQETHLRVDAAGRLSVSVGRTTVPELAVFGWESFPSRERPRLFEGELPEAPAPEEPLLPDTSAMTFREEAGGAPAVAPDEG